MSVYTYDMDVFIWNGKTLVKEDMTARHATTKKLTEKVT